MPTRLGPFLLLFIGVIQVEAEYCSLYTECVAVARLEERLCLGNSRKRPFWLPQLNDPHECHEKLKADYKRLELLEVELDSAFTSCTLEKNGTQNENASCSRIAENTPKFVRGRTIDYVPTHCFSGIDARTTRQCGPLKQCCSSIIGCESILSSSPEYDRIKAAAFEMRKRANDCERGLEIPPLAEYRSTVKKPNGGMEDEKKEKSILTPSGTITITVTDISTTPASTATATTEKSESNPEEHEATTVTTSPIRVDAEESANRTSYNDLNTAIFDHLDKHEKQVKEMLEKEGQPVHPSTTPEPEFLDQPHLSFPTGTTGKGSASSEVQVPASGDKVEEAEADFGLSIGRGQSSDDTLKKGNGVGGEGKEAITKSFSLTTTTNRPILITADHIDDEENENMTTTSVIPIENASKSALIRINTTLPKIEKEKYPLTLKVDPKFPPNSVTSIPRTSGGPILTVRFHTENETIPEEMNANWTDGEATIMKRNGRFDGRFDRRFGFAHFQGDREIPIEEHLRDFRELMKTTRKREIKLIDQTLSSLFKAAEVPSDESRLAGDTVRSEARFTEGENGQAESPLRGVVTSAPMILIPDNSDGPRRAPIPSTNCGLKRLRATKSFKMEKILNLLGENQNSDDMQEIRGLLDNWQNEVRATLLDAKRRNKNRAIDQALDKLIDHFDTVNIGLLKESANANFEESEYPDEDAQIAAMECEPIGDEEGSGGDRIDGSGSTETPVEGSGAIEGSGTEQPTTGEPTQWTEIRRTENGDKIVVDGGVEKIVFGDGSLQIDNKANVTDTDEAPVNTEWMQRYRAEVERLHKDREDEFGGRNESSCDLYMRCRNQMHLALDGCAWRFASVKILMSLAESSESLLYRGDDLCDPSDRPFYESLYELMIKRNGKIRECLEDKNKNIFDKAVCIPYPPEKSALYDDALLRILSVDYPKSAQCFGDANLIQEKCSRLRECCPHFDRCREDSLDIALEQAILSKTAQVNERKQLGSYGVPIPKEISSVVAPNGQRLRLAGQLRRNQEHVLEFQNRCQRRYVVVSTAMSSLNRESTYCLRSKARTNFKQTLRDLLGKGSWKTIEMIRNGEIGAKVGGFDRLRYRKVYRV